MLTQTSLKHPVMQDRILAGLIEAQEKAEKDGHGRAYVANSKKNNIMRIDVFKPDQLAWLPKGGVIVYGESSRTITPMVEAAMGYKLADLI